MTTIIRQHDKTDSASHHPAEDAYDQNTSVYEENVLKIILRDSTFFEYNSYLHVIKKKASKPRLY